MVATIVGTLFDAVVVFFGLLLVELRWQVGPVLES